MNAFRSLLAWTAALLALLSLSSSADAQALPPISLHPQNPHYFLFRGRPTVLVTSGEHYGADVGNRRVVRLDPQLRCRYELRFSPAGRNEDAEPWDVAAAPDDGCVVAYEGHVVRFDAQGGMDWHCEAQPVQLRFERMRGRDGMERGGGIGVAPDGTVVIVQAQGNLQGPSGANSMILVLGRKSFSARPGLQLTGKRTFSAAGRGQFNHPCGVAVDLSGRIYVADFNNHRVQKFDSRGRFLLQFGVSRAQEWADYLEPPKANGDMRWPVGVALDEARDRVYVADWGGDRIDMFTPDGKWLRPLASGIHPWGLAVAPGGMVFASDPKAKVVHRFGADGKLLGDIGGAGTFHKPGMLSFADGKLYSAVDQR